MAKNLNSVILLNRISRLINYCSERRSFPIPFIPSMSRNEKLTVCTELIHKYSTMILLTKTHSSLWSTHNNLSMSTRVRCHQSRVQPICRVPCALPVLSPVSIAKWSSKAKPNLNIAPLPNENFEPTAAPSVSKSTSSSIRTPPKTNGHFDYIHRTHALIGFPLCYLDGHVAVVFGCKVQDMPFPCLDSMADESFVCTPPSFGRCNQIDLFADVIKDGFYQ